MRLKRLLLVPVILSLLAGDSGAAAAGAHPAESDTIGRVCFQPFPETEEQFIQRHFTQADAVFSGFVRELTLERANVLVLGVWKGALSAEVVLPTGVRDNGDGTFTYHSESFTFRKGATYLLFGYGKSTESMTTSVCKPNGLLKESATKVAILDKFVKGGR